MILFTLQLADGSRSWPVASTWLELGPAVSILRAEIRRHDGFEVSASEVAALAGLTVRVVELTLRIGACYAAREHERGTGVRPVVTLPRGREPRALTVVDVAVSA